MPYQARAETLLAVWLDSEFGEVTEEDDVNPEIRAWANDYVQKLRIEERQAGRAEEAALSVLTVLRARGLAAPEAVRERILAEKDRERLEQWLERAATAASVTEVLDEPS